MPADAPRALEPFVQRVEHGGHVGAVSRLRLLLVHHEGELVAAVAVQARARAERLQKLRERAQKPVAVVVAELVVDELEVRKRHEQRREGPLLIEHERHHRQELLAVRRAREQVHRKAFVLEVQVDDQQRAGCGRTRQQVRGKHLLHGDHHDGDERKHRQDALDGGIDGRAGEHDEREAGDAVEVEHEVRGEDERPLMVAAVPVEPEQAVRGEVRDDDEGVQGARHGAHDDLPGSHGARLAHHGHGVVEVDGAQQRREHEVDGGDDVGERQQRGRRVGDHEGGGEVRADGADGGDEAQAEQHVLARGHRVASARIHRDDQHDYEGDGLRRNVPYHSVFLPTLSTRLPHLCQRIHVHTL